MGYVSSVLTGRDSNQEIRGSEFSKSPAFHGTILVSGTSSKHTVWYRHEVDYTNVSRTIPTSALTYTSSNCHITFKTL
jgi:hypothetical protein